MSHKPEHNPPNQGKPPHGGTPPGHGGPNAGQGQPPHGGTPPGHGGPNPGQGRPTVVTPGRTSGGQPAIPPDEPLRFSHKELERLRELLAGADLADDLMLRARNTRPQHHYVTGTLRPFSLTSDVGQVVALMQKLKPISVYPGGQLVPVDTVESPTPVLNIERIKAFELAFEIIPFKNALPRAYAIRPRLDRRFPHRVTEHLWLRPHPSYEKNKHFPDCELCVVAAQDAIIPFGLEGIVALYWQLAIWAGAYAAWQFGGLTAWPIPSAPHTALERWRETPPEAPCPMGHARPYAACCRPTDEVQALREYLYFSQLHPVQGRRTI